MTKKVIDSNKLRETLANQGKATQDRFDRADSILLREPPTALAEPVPKKTSVGKNTFSMPPNDHAIIEKIRSLAAKEGRISTKSEVIRAGLHALALLTVDKLIVVFDNLEKIKPGRKN